MVSAEYSSDFLGGSVAEKTLELYNQSNLAAGHNPLEFAGCGGEKMAAKGVRLLLDNKVFSKVGILSILLNYPALFANRNKLLQSLLAFQPDVFFGIDGYSLNLHIAKTMQKNNIPVVHLVAPKLLFSRKSRLANMQKYIDQLLCLFPYELDDYQDLDIKAMFVGHPMADVIPVDKPTKAQSKYEIGIEPNATVIAIMPGSRKSLLKSHLPVVKQLALQLRKKHGKGVRIVSTIPAEYTQWYKNELGDLIDFVSASSTALLMASDVSVVATGTVALEAMLCNTPMVVFIRVQDALSKYLALRTLAGREFSLPNLLSNHCVKEFIIDAIEKDAEQMADLVSQYLEQPPTEMLHQFTIQHRRLRQNAALKTAQILLQHAVAKHQ